MELRKCNLIGKGSYGQIYKAKLENKDVAVKKFNNLGSGWEKDSLRELVALCTVPQCEGLIKLHFGCLDKQLKPQIVLPLFKHTLSSYLHENNFISPEYVLIWSAQIICAIAQMHEHGFAHRDIKMENILIDDSNRVVICDFGMSRYMSDFTREENLSNHVCSLWTKSPELLKGSTQYSKNIDAWSIGCVMLALASGHYVIRTTEDHKSPLDMIEQYFAHKDKLTFIMQSCKRQDLPIEFYELVSDLLDVNEFSRLTVIKASQSKLVQTYNAKFVSVSESNNSHKALNNSIIPTAEPLKNVYSVSPDILKWTTDVLKSLTCKESTKAFIINCLRRLEPSKNENLLYVVACCSLIYRLNESMDLKVSVWTKFCGCKVKDLIQCEHKILQLLHGKILN
jgi:serine/threonine protein kinase